MMKKLMIAALLCTTLVSATEIAPNDSRITITGSYFTKSSDTLVQFQRHTDEALAVSSFVSKFSAQNAMTETGVTIQFKSDAPLITAHFRMMEGVNRSGSFAVFADGVLIDEPNFGPSGDSLISFNITAPSTGITTYEITMPNWGTITFRGFTIADGSDIFAVEPKNAPRYVAFGNSITHGTKQRGTHQTYPYLLAKAMGWELNSVAVGGARTSMTIADMIRDSIGTIDYMTILIGYNDYNGEGADTATYSERIHYLIDEVRSTHKDTKIFCISATTTTNVISKSDKSDLPITDFRKVVEDLVAEKQAAGDTNIYLIQGETISTEADLADGDAVHFSIEGASRFATKLTAEIKQLLTTSELSDSLLFMRTEYDAVGHFIGTVEGGTALSGDDANFFTIDPSTGKITTTQIIPDEFGVIHEQHIVVATPKGDVAVTIVDGLDYLVSKHTGRVITDHQTGAISDTLGEWASYNNLWGDGTAIPNQDYRIVMLVSDSMPNGSSIVWDTPGSAKDFSGSSVWNYTNFMFGARQNQRPDLEGFPFCIDSLEELKITFDYTPIIGDDQFKVALNMFLTDDNEIVPMSKNRGDFFFVLDQKGRWIPPYDSVVVEDTAILGEQFTLLYDTLTQNGGVYERRRVIVKNDGRVQNGEIDILSYFNRFAEEGMLKKEQSIPNIQFGVEVTSGFGAITVHHLSIDKIMKNPTTVALPLQMVPKQIQILQRGNTILLSNTQNFNMVSLYSLNGREIYRQNIGSTESYQINSSNLAQGSYILKMSGTTSFIQKIVIK